VLSARKKSAASLAPSIANPSTRSSRLRMG
jgi:hypothetical protein